MLALASCNTLKYVDEGDHLVENNKIVLESEEKISNKRNLEYELRGQLKQEPNRKMFRLFRSRLWFYYKTRDTSKNSKITKWARRVIAEAPILFDSTLAVTSAKNLKQYMQNKGYMDTAVKYEVEYKNKKAYTQYNVYPKKRYLIGEYKLRSSDQGMVDIVEKHSSKSFLKAPAAMDLSNYNNEKVRISKILKDHGYAFFNQNYISLLEVDTTHKPYSAYIDILNPINEENHQAYHIGEVNVIINKGPLDTLAFFNKFEVDGYNYYTKLEELEIKAKTIQNELYLRSGDLYSQSNVDKTYQNLSNLGNLKFVYIKHVVDSLRPDHVNIDISVRLNKKRVLGGDLDLYSSNYQAGTSLLGISLSGLYRNRNTFRGAEIFDIRVDGGTELDFSEQNDGLLFSLDFGVNADLFVPKYFNPYRWFRKVNIFELRFDSDLNLFRRFRRILEENATTRFSLGFNYLDVTSSFSYQSFKFELGYNVPISKRHTILFSRIGLDYLVPLAEFPAGTSDLVVRSFDEQLFTGFLFRDLQYFYRSAPNKWSESWNFNAGVEASGLEIQTINALVNSGKSLAARDTFKLNGAIDFAKYMRLQVGGGYTKEYSPKESIAARVKTSLGFPFGYSGDVPFVKQYYVGGAFFCKGLENPGIRTRSLPRFYRKCWVCLFTNW